jgi:hypothetical protein
MAHRWLQTQQHKPPHPIPAVASIVGEAVPQPLAHLMSLEPSVEIANSLLVGRGDSGNSARPTRPGLSSCTPQRSQSPLQPTVTASRALHWQRPGPRASTACVTLRHDALPMVPPSDSESLTGSRTEVVNSTRAAAASLRQSRAFLAMMLLRHALSSILIHHLGVAATRRFRQRICVRPESVNHEF